MLNKGSAAEYDEYFYRDNDEEIDEDDAITPEEHYNLFLRKEAKEIKTNSPALKQ